MLCTNLWTGENVKFGEWEGLYAISINCFVSHHPTDPLFFKVPFKENKTDPNFFKFQLKKVFNLKELYYFKIIFLVFLFSDRLTQPFEWRLMGNRTFY